MRVLKELAQVNLARLRFPLDAPQTREFVEAVDRIQTPATALWWVAEGHRPTPVEALARLKYLRTWGPTPQAFTVRSRFTASGERERRFG